jgi:Uma2 family endonuclease
MVVKQLVTAEDLLAMPEESGVRYELVAGELVEVPGTGGVHNLIAALIFVSVRAFSRAQKLGPVFTDGMGFVLRRHPDLVRIPDVAFVAWERIPNRQVPEGFLYLAPDLAVEVVSPFDRANDVYSKVHEYLEAGTRLVWVVWPRHGKITVYEPDKDPRELGPDDYLEGGDVLPGFRVLVAELFDVSE